MVMNYLFNMVVEKLIIVKLLCCVGIDDSCKVGVVIVKVVGGKFVIVFVVLICFLVEIVFGLILCIYIFDVCKFGEKIVVGNVVFVVKDVSDVVDVYIDLVVVVDGVFFICDLVSELVNVLIIIEFVDCLMVLLELGVEVEVFEEDKLVEFGMNLLLLVG